MCNMKQKQVIIFKIIGFVIIFGMIFSCRKNTSTIPPIPVPIDPLQNFVLIPATINPFLMGSPDGTNGTIREFGRDTNEVQHKVLLDSFYINKYEVTIGEFKDFLASKDINYLLPNDPKSIANYYNIGWNETDKHPITNLSWNAATRFCNWRSKRVGLDTCYIFKANGMIDSCNFNNKGYRLPTEAEWEYACRGEGKLIPFATGNNITTDQANYNGYFPYNNNPQGNFLQKTVPVDAATYYKNSFQLEHMHGNVWEWCWDWFDPNYYPTDGSIQNNPKGPTTGIATLARVFRGGSWYNDAVYLRSAYRYREAPAYRYKLVGFRLAKTK